MLCERWDSRRGSVRPYNLQGIEGQSQCDGDRSCHLWFAYSGKTLCACRNFIVLDILNNGNTPSRTLKKTRLLTHLTQTPTSPASLRLPRQSLRPRTCLFQAGPQRAITFLMRALRARRAPGRSSPILLTPRVARARGSSQLPRRHVQHPAQIS